MKEIRGWFSVKTQQIIIPLLLFLSAAPVIAERNPMGFPEDGITATRIAETDKLTVFRLGALQKGQDSVALLDPMLFQPGILAREDGLIQSLLDDDLNVYLLMWKSPGDSIQTVLMGAEIEKAVSMARTDCECSDFVAGGISLGGQRWLPYLERLESSDDIMVDNRGTRIRSVFFLGAGLDYSYPGSLYTGNRYPINTDLSQNCMDLGAPCLGFIPGRHFKAGLRLRAIPPALAPGDLSTARMFPSIRRMTIPVAFIYGKIDGFSPEETLFPIFEIWGETTYLQEVRKEYDPYDTENPVMWLEGSEANRLNDYDHFDLFLHPDADAELYGELTDWIEDAERKSDH
ncbi:MAG: hypothetical protein RH862_07310 [Leptospiraceae bacterium]